MKYFKFLIRLLKVIIFIALYSIGSYVLTYTIDKDMSFWSAFIAILIFPFVVFLFVVSLLGIELTVRILLNYLFNTKRFLVGDLWISKLLKKLGL